MVFGKRKKILINPRFQLTMVSYFFAVTFAACVSFYVMITVYFSNLEQKALEKGLPKGHVFFKFIEDQQGNLSTYFIVTSVVVSLFIIIGGLLISHKVAGPIYRLTMYLDENAKSKECPEIQFRSGDFFPEVPKSFNRFLNK